MQTQVYKNQTPAVAIDDMPDHQQDAMARTLIGCISRWFDDPAVKADFERWKVERAQRVTCAAH